MQAGFQNMKSRKMSRYPAWSEYAAMTGINVTGPTVRTVRLGGGVWELPPSGRCREEAVTPNLSQPSLLSHQSESLSSPP